MNLGDVAKKTVPKMCLVSLAATGRRDFDAHVHSASRARSDRRARRGQRRDGVRPSGIGRGGGRAKVSGGERQRLDVEHPTGFFTVDMDVEATGSERRGEAVRAAAHRAQADARRSVRARSRVEARMSLQRLSARVRRSRPGARGRLRCARRIRISSAWDILFPVADSAPRRASTAKGVRAAASVEDAAATRTWSSAR